MAAKPYLIGVSGPSGAGKTYLATHLASTLHASILGLDRYHRDLSHLPMEHRACVNFDAPDALDYELLVEQISALRNRGTVPLPVYDFATHTRSSRTELWRPAEIVIIEGLFILHWPRLRDLLGTKVFVDMNDVVCLARRQVRDVRERGRTLQSVAEQYTATVAPMAVRYVRPTIVHADVVVSGTDPVSDSVSRVLEHYRRQIASDKPRQPSSHV